VTVEAGRDGNPDEVHFHPGGQGLWIARMLRVLGETPWLCAPVGGESGRVLRGLLREWEIDLSPLETGLSSPVTVQDRRSGERELIAETGHVHLTRHELDDAYGKLLDRSLAANVCVLTGQSTETVPVDTYRRLGHDLSAAEVRVVADLHGPELSALLEGGGVEMLKVSHEDLSTDGRLEGEDEKSVIASITALREEGATNVVVSRSNLPTIAWIGDVLYRATVPDLEPADFRGAGDSMTAALAAGLRRGLKPVELLELACGAGAANVTRHGLGSASSELITKLADRIEVEILDPVPA
jgi:1-phosphofructokinase